MPHLVRALHLIPRHFAVVGSGSRRIQAKAYMARATCSCFRFSGSSLPEFIEAKECKYAISQRFDLGRRELGISGRTPSPVIFWWRCGERGFCSQPGSFVWAYSGRASCTAAAASAQPPSPSVRVAEPAQGELYIDWREAALAAAGLVAPDQQR